MHEDAKHLAGSLFVWKDEKRSKERKWNMMRGTKGFKDERTEDGEKKIENLQKK